MTTEQPQQRGRCEQWLGEHQYADEREFWPQAFTFAREVDTEIAALRKSNLMWFEESKKFAAEIAAQRTLIETLVTVLEPQ